jgi:hypothetical protein
MPGPTPCIKAVLMLITRSVIVHHTAPCLVSAHHCITTFAQTITFLGASAGTMDIDGIPINNIMKITAAIIWVLILH